MKNRVYMDKLPQDCFECPMFRNDIYVCCGLDDGVKDYHNFAECDDNNCPLRMLNTYNKKANQIIRSLKDLNKKKAKEISSLRKQIKEIQCPRMSDKTRKDIKHDELMNICKQQKRELEQLKSSFGKFESVDELVKAYECLQREYTKARTELSNIKKGEKICKK